ncbi:hypothetical protein CEXT_189431 [Caerostris extrusa]|uniref:Uncharacterized protein n=1 Tax=Caerostris extrusa TaxID=172846 RepID=A0AAV4SCM3_CAEEX|nr:hypothetical protein CEXT_189431 [Caerostris extrusa]
MQESNVLFCTNREFDISISSNFPMGRGSSGHNCDSAAYLVRPDDLKRCCSFSLESQLDFRVWRGSSGHNGDSAAYLVRPDDIERCCSSRWSPDWTSVCVSLGLTVFERRGSSGHNCDSAAYLVRPDDLKRCCSSR